MKLPLFATVFLAAVHLFAAETPRLIAPDEKKHLVLDSRVIVSANNARLVPGTVVKEPRNPLLHVAVFAPLIVAIGGTTDRTAEPSVDCTMVNVPVTSVASMYRNSASTLP